MAVLLGLAAAPTQAEEFTIRAATTRLSNNVYVLDAAIDLEFSDRALNALESGVPLVIQLDFEIQRQREWWLDADVAELQQRFQLSYHALSGLYVARNLNSGASEAWPTLDAALAALGAISELPLLDQKLLEPDASYLISMRVDLDIESLPLPLRPLAYVTPAWWLGSDWITWSLEP